MSTDYKDIQTRLIRKILDLSDEDQLALLSQLEGEIGSQLDDDPLPPDKFEQRESKRDDDPLPPGEFEQRKSKRNEYQNTINFFHGTDSFWGFINNISKTGLYIETDGSFELGWSLTAILPLPDSDKTVEIPVRVARKDPDGIGMEFIKRLNNGKK